MKLSSKNIESAIDELKKKLKSQNIQIESRVLWVPSPKWVLTKRYRGKGRPRKSDYDWLDIPQIIKELIKD